MSTCNVHWIFRILGVVSELSRQMYNLFKMLALFIIAGVRTMKSALNYIADITTNPANLCAF